MSDHRGPNNWYDTRRNNRRALKSRARKRLKYGAKKDTESELDGMFLDPASNYGNCFEGTLATLAPPLFSILSKEQVVLGRAEVAGQFALLSHLAIGDRVVFDYDIKKSPILKGVLPRHSRLARLRADATRISLAGAEEHVLAANIDLAVIVASAVSPAFHPRLVDRYMIMCQYGNVEPLLCITKIDLALCPDVLAYKRIGLKVVCISNKTREGLESLYSCLKGRCCVLTGHSGVGKSSIINTLLEREILPVSNVSEKSGKGRHTTVNGSLHIIGANTYLIDTPGIRSLGLWDIHPATLRKYFREFVPFESQCRYRDCTHASEPDCAVRRAVESGLVAPQRYESYIRLLNNSAL